MNIYFLHLAKSGGLSLRKTFDGIPNHYTYDIVDFFVDHEQYEKQNNNIVYGHANYSLFNLMKSDTQVFTILRDPVDRLISLWKHYERENQNVVIKPLFYKTAKEILEDPLFQFVVNGQLKQISNDIDYSLIYEEVKKQPYSAKVSWWSNNFGTYVAKHRDHTNHSYERLRDRSKEILSYDHVKYCFFDDYENGVKNILQSYGFENMQFYKENVAPKDQPCVLDTPEARNTLTEMHEKEYELYNWAREKYETQSNNKKTT